MTMNYTSADHRNWNLQQQVQLVQYIRSYDKPNVLGARVRINFKINFSLAYHLAASASDREVLQYLMFEWPLNHDGRPVTVTLKNHKSAEKFPQHVTQYICKEMKLKCLFGPFLTIPWDSKQVAVSPMSTRAKKDSSSRRIIMDLSWLLNGTAVNDGISAETYMGQQMDLHYPTVDDLCKRAAKLGVECRCWKYDLDRAFKQWYCDPINWLHLGIMWNNVLLFDKTTVMGCRSAPYCCQRITNFIRHIMNNIQYFVANYVDDFMGLELSHKAWQAYNALGNLLRDLGIDESLDKAIPPSEEIEFLGVLYNLAKQTISVTPQRLHQFEQEL